MPELNCQSCGFVRDVSEKYAGRRVRCPQCKQTVTVAELGVATETTQDIETVDARVAVATAPTTGGPPPRPPKRSPQSSRGSPVPVPPRPNQDRIASHEIDYEILGAELQLVEIELDPGETVIAEAGAMAYMDEGIQFEARMGDGSMPNQGFFGALFSGAKRAVTGESFFLTHFTNRATGKTRVAFSAPYPGNIMPLNLSNYGGVFTCQKDAFLCAALGTTVGIAFAKKLGAGFFGGEGFVLQRLEGDGLAFIQAGGTVVIKELQGNTILVDTGCLVGFTDGIEYSIERAGNLKSMIFGGEGLFLARLHGHGTVMLQSLPFSRLADRIIANAPTLGGKSSGEGSILGGITDIFSD